MIKIEEEFELFQDVMKPMKEKEAENIIINGDVIIEMKGEEPPQMDKITKEIRNTIKPKWKKRIKKRDKNFCQCCGIKTNHLEIHHIMPLSQYPELKNDEKNAISLCQKCHDRYHKRYKGEAGAVTFSQYLRNYGRAFSP